MGLQRRDVQEVQGSSVDKAVKYFFTPYTMSFTRRTGNPRFREFTASGTIAAGDVVQFDEGGEVAVGATNKGVVGVAVNAATSSTNCIVDIAYPGDEWNATIATGTMAKAEIGQDADLSDENDLTLTESNSDFRITGWDGVTTTSCYGTFLKTTFTAAVGAE